MVEAQPENRSARDGNVSRFAPYVRAGDLVFVSGQASLDEHGTIVRDTFEGEMRRSIERVRRFLGEAGLTLADVVKVGAFVRDPADLAEFNRIYSQFFGERLPARTTLTNCISERIKFEIEVVALARRFDTSR